MRRWKGVSVVLEKGQAQQQLDPFFHGGRRDTTAAYAATSVTTFGIRAQRTEEEAMHTRVELDAATGPSYVSTGRLPSPEQIRALVAEAHEHYRVNGEGQNSQVYPALARVPSKLFGICVVGTSGNVYEVRDADYEFTIMSVSKPFVFALVCQAARRRGGAQENRRQRHRTSLQLASRHRAGRRRADEPDGEFGSDRHDQPGAGGEP